VKKVVENNIDLVATIDLLLAKIKENNETIEMLKSCISELEQKVVDRDNTIIGLKDQIATFQRNIFGTKSEKTHKQENEANHSIAKCSNQTESTVEYAKNSVKKGYVHPTKRNYDHIEPTKITHIFPTKEEMQGARFVREEISYHFTYIPAHIEKEKIIRHIYSKGGHLIIPSLPYAPEEFEKRHLDASLAAGILINKYYYHMPYERQLTMLNGGDLKIAKTTLYNYGNAGIDALEGLFNAIKDKVLSDNRCNADETVQHVVDKTIHKCRNGYDWGFVSPKYRMMFFTTIKGSRSKEVLDSVMKDFKGRYLQTDGYNAYSAVGERLGKDIVQIPCMSHIKRKFNDSLLYHKEKASEAIELINEMFRIENEIKLENKTGTDIAAARRKRLKPALEKFKIWLIKMKESDGFLNDDNLGKAVNYALDKVDKFYPLIKNGLLSLQNNLAESCMRGHTLGRKNYLFCQNDESELRTCKIYSIIESCKLSGIDPYEYLKYIFSHKPLPGERWEDLIPCNIKHKFM